MSFFSSKTNFTLKILRGVNMYAMLAGKLPFKVENRSKNLAKLHACILKGCEIPSYLTPGKLLLKLLLNPILNFKYSNLRLSRSPQTITRSITKFTY